MIASRVVVPPEDRKKADKGAEHPAQADDAYEMRNCVDKFINNQIEASLRKRKLRNVAIENENFFFCVPKVHENELTGQKLRFLGRSYFGSVN